MTLYRVVIMYTNEDGYEVLETTYFSCKVHAEKYRKKFMRCAPDIIVKCTAFKEVPWDEDVSV